MLRKNVQMYDLFQEISAGGVVVTKQENKIKFVVIDRKIIRDTSLPKGHQKKEESLQQTAVREVKEETGFDAKVVKYLGNFTYEVELREKKRIVLRTVHWFLMIIVSGEPRSESIEVERVKLKSLDSDLSELTYENDRALIKEVRKVINNYL